MEVKVDRAGRMVIPAGIRRLLGLGTNGGVVELVDGPDGISIRSREAATPGPTRDEHGLLVLDVGREVTNDEVLEAIERDRARRG